MEVKNKILLLAFFITLFVFLSLLLLGTFLDNERFNQLDEQFNELQVNINDVQRLMIMSDVYGDEMVCVAFSSKLSDLDKTIWDLGIKLEQYRVASEEFQKDPYYTAQKRLFNEQEVLYLTLLTQIKDTCNYSQPIITFFYSNAKDCTKCDDQSFVLSDINMEMDEQVSIFSFDTELNLSSIRILQEFYGLGNLPCIVINEETFCGIKSKKFILEKICKDTDDCEA